MNLKTASLDELKVLEASLAAEYVAYQTKGISLDLTRGKPSSQQLNISNSLDGILEGNYISENGTDTRNYGGLEGLIEARRLGAEILKAPVETVLAQGNSSLTLMFLAMLTAKEFGFRGPESAWKKDNQIKFICPVPGYDRHFTLCEQLGIEMITAPMTANGPDMDSVEAMISSDPSIKGIWCVPKYSNPTGVIYSEETIDRLAALGNIAGDNFCIFYDNAYAVHDLAGYKPLSSIYKACEKHGTEDSIIQFASTSKITLAGAGVAFISASPANIAGFKKVLGTLSIGPDKVNQLRHMKLIPDFNALLDYMEHHAAELKPRFDCVLDHLNKAFGDNELGSWEPVDGGYFISFDCLPNLATTIISMAADLGVKLTPAGATFPYGKDPENRNIRIAPSVPTLEEVDEAMKVFVLCVKLASVRQAINAK